MSEQVDTDALRKAAVYMRGMTLNAVRLFAAESDQVEAAADELDALRATVARVEALHRPDYRPGQSGETVAWCTNCLGSVWPCHTIATLNPEVG